MAKSWFGAPPLLAEAEVDLDDARVKQELQQQSGAQQQQPQHGGGLFPPEQQQAAADGLSAYDILARTTEREACGDEQLEREFAASNVSRSLGLPLEQRMQPRAASKSKTKQSTASAFDESPGRPASPSASSSSDAVALWRASNLVWAGAPRVDRGATISNALQTVDLLHQINSNAAHHQAAGTSGASSSSSSSSSESKSAMSFSATLFSLRQIAAVILTANSSRRGDCLATQGQLAGTMLSAATPSTTATRPATASPSRWLTSVLAPTSTRRWTSC